jgi:hypothetical protein
MNKGGFSWKRALGVTRAKARLSRKTGIPLTRSGRQRKVGRAVTGGGCLLTGLMICSVAALVCRIGIGYSKQDSLGETAY